MSTSNLDNNEWRECPPGTLRLHAKRIRWQKLQRQTVRLGSLFLVVALGSTFAYAWLSGGKSNPTRSEPNYGGIVCSAVKRNSSQFLAGQLDEATAEKIRAHMQQCPVCEAYIQQMRQNISSRSAPQIRYVGKQLNFGEKVAVE